ncbi:hypothetical protein [Streptomyces sp. NBC_00887]|uniref:hypothetical protein n=1 Tax=Streptomyces sp. NBC_00887 TaxID=2975859 RepID=UPI00386A9344|nr:hypothetical protein OG844_01035 [Streptomyces sp. NBC_00887]WSY36243.1 hypothetical protein OG844_44560 [Streptomyces sp. NBC_00887]
MAKERKSVDAAQLQRSLRFSKLPAPVRLEDTVEERSAAPRDTQSGVYNAHWWLIRMGGL